MNTALAPDGAALACRNCGEALRRLVLRGHYGRPVEIDDCRTCHLLWFDGVEAARLSGSGMIDLIREMAAGHAQPHRPLRHDLGCARCAGPVRLVVNRSRFGQAEQLECGRGHGAWHSYGQWLAERGFVRPVTSIDMAALAREGVVRACFNCGGPAAAGDLSACGWCGAAAVLMDVGRLLRAVDPEGATRPPAADASPTVGGSTGTAGARRGSTAAVESSCHACGDTGAGAATLRCAGCGATRMAGDLGVAMQALAEIEPALRAHEVRPADHVRSRRLAALDGDLDRRRETVRVLERQARGGMADDHRSDHGSSDGGLPFSFGRGRIVAWGIGLAGLLWVLWGR